MSSSQTTWVSRSLVIRSLSSAFSHTSATAYRVGCNERHRRTNQRRRARSRPRELDLERAVAANRAVPGAVGDRELARLRSHVILLQRQFEIARALPRTAARQATIAAAELAGDNARAALDAALKANHRVPGSVSDLNIERLRARLELAEIRVALCRNPAFELSLLDEMQWSIDQLTDQLIDLRHQVETRGTADVGKPD